MARKSKSEVEQITGGRIKLTGALVDSLKCPTGKKQAFFRDVDAVGLALRVTEGGSRAFVFEAKINGKAVRQVIGTAHAGSLEDARGKARKLRTDFVDQAVDPRVVAAERKAKDAAAKAEAARLAEHTVAALGQEYANHLRGSGRSSWRKVEADLKRHIPPKVGRLPASALEAETVTDLLRKLDEAGKHRTAGKVRSYLNAAFELARRARVDFRVPVRFKEFGVSSNPVSLTPATTTGVDKNPASLAELRTYWSMIQADTFEHAVLRVHLLLGGQRVEQLARVGVADVAEDRLTMIELKGGRKAASVKYTSPTGEQMMVRRLHTLPITQPAAQALADLRRHAAHVEGYLISRDGGKTHCTANAVAKWAKSATAAALPKFQIKQVRSGVETELGGAGVSREIRGHLLSHGIHGVQAAHYDGGEYLPEKLRALETFHRLLTQESAQVIVMPQRTLANAGAGS